ncbi:MAG TPA: PQQ-binding-like beta-propeller repeat protein [Candidatus Limnocylindrales bacterium]|nr:PQQ-binding-like beta-propeller repeat protein [Candidatus Limnocylindrales bacterium]
MQFFNLIRSGVDVGPLLEEIDANAGAWLLETGRQDRIRVQRDTNTIFLCSAVHRPDLNINENQETRATEVAQLFPRALAFMTEFAAETNCQLSRATIVRLKPRSQVFRHIDQGSYYFLRDRFHLVLRSPAGSALMSGGETVRMQEGELWWFDNKQYHESYNESAEWRIHYIFDLLPAEYADVAVNPVLLPPEPSRPPQTGDSYVPAAPHPTDKSQFRDLVFAAIRDYAILRNETQRLISPAGKPNQWLIDIRRVFMNPKSLDAAAELFWEECAQYLPFQVGGMESAAIPLLSAILLKSQARQTPVNGFIIRKERKPYGSGSSVDGVITRDPIVLVDDVVNSGASLEKARAVLEQQNKRISSIYTLVDYESAMGAQWRQEHAVPVLSAFRLSQFGLSTDPPICRPMATFRNRWHFAAPDPNFFHRVPKSFPVTDNKRVYFGSDCGNFWCLSANSGSPEWTFQVNAHGHKNIWSSAALHDGRIYFGSYDGNVYCLDADTGNEIWRFTGADWVGSSPALAPDLGLLFIGLEFAVEGKRGSIAALRLDNGDKVWEHSTRRYTHASPAYSPERHLVACGSNDNELFLFDASTGALRWRFETRGSVRHAPAFDLERDQVITGCADSYIYIVGIESGREVWSVKTDNTIYTVPLMNGDKAYVGSTDKYLYILDLDSHTVKRKIYAGSKIYGPPRLLAGRIYFGACSGMVYEIDPASDDVTATHQLPDAVTNALTYNPETGDFYALTYVNELFAFRRNAK